MGMTNGAEVNLDKDNFIQKFNIMMMEADKIFVLCVKGDYEHDPDTGFYGFDNDAELMGYLEGAKMFIFLKTDEIREED